LAALGRGSAAPRLSLVDVLRGAAIVAMIAYHFAWDLAYLGFLYDITVDPRWIWFQRSILGSFLVLVGIGLVLGHGGPEGIRWRAFWRRWLILVLAAAAMSLATWFAFGEAFAFFGILHAIALFSLVGLLFLRLPWWATAAVAAAVVALGATVTIDGFGERWLAWIGFWGIPPWTADLVSVFPWFGATLAGIALGKLLPLGSSPRAGSGAWLWWRPGDPVTRGLRVLGRWSLLIYLIHQPLILAVLYPLAGWLRSGVAVAETVSDPVAFVAQCRPACEAGGSPAGYCVTYCDCAAGEIAAGDLWDEITAPEASPAVDQVMRLCRAMAEAPRSAPLLRS
jgi:uncharacterized membrane protein